MEWTLGMMAASSGSRMATGQTRRAAHPSHRHSGVIRQDLKTIQTQEMAFPGTSADFYYPKATYLCFGA
jgi:hypothetical protein